MFVSGCRIQGLGGQGSDFSIQHAEVGVIENQTEEA